MLLSDIAARTGGAFCRPVSAPAQVSEQRWGVSDPASASHMRPRARPAGSLTPHTPVSVMCWGARWMVAEMRVKTLPFSWKTTIGNDPECRFEIDRIPGQNSGRF